MKRDDLLTSAMIIFVRFLSLDEGNTTSPLEGACDGSNVSVYAIAKGSACDFQKC